jgi:hypothetical protein
MLTVLDEFWKAFYQKRWLTTEILHAIDRKNWKQIFIQRYTIEKALAKEDGIVLGVWDAETYLKAGELLRRCRICFLLFLFFSSPFLFYFFLTVSAGRTERLVGWTQTLFSKLLEKNLLLR